MIRYAVLLRGINIGPHNPVAMPRLREVLAAAGFGAVDSYLRSGNIVLDSDLTAGQLAAACEHEIAAHFALSIPVVVRSAAELAEVIRRNPFGAVAANPKLYQVSFLSADPPPGLAGRLADVAGPTERAVVIGREIYTWLPEGVARSKLAALAPGGGVVATARNWTTVTALAAMAAGPSAQS